MQMPNNNHTPADTNQIIPLVIIGGGFSAAALTIHLCKSDPEIASSITILSEDSGTRAFGSGAAFGTDNPHFRLNVRSDIMKLFSDRPDDFGKWAATNISDKQASQPEGNFYRRSDFARYMTATLERICTKGLPAQISTTAITLRQQGELWHILHRAGDMLMARNIVLATGNPVPRWPCAVNLAEHTKQSGSHTSGKLAVNPKLVVNPWDGSWLDRLEADDALCLIGGGLTAMDGIYAAAQTGHRARIMLVSPHGILPPAQTDWQTRPAIKWPEEPLTASRFLSYMRAHLKQAGHDWTQTGWQEMFESLRIELSDKWRELTENDKCRLLKQAGSWWSLARYRSAPQNFAAAQAMLASGQLSIIKDRVISLTEEGGRIKIRLASGKVLSSDMAVNCSGVATDLFFERLITDNVIRACAFGQSPEVTRALAVYRPDAKAYDNLFALGAATKGSCGDVVGAGTIAGQAEQLSKILAGRISSDLS